MLFLSVIINQNLQGKIKNGYEVDIEKVGLALINLQQILKRNELEMVASKRLSYIRKKQIKSRIAGLEEHLIYYELTEKLLMQFRIIAPDLFQQVDTIKDYNGAYTDVHIKFIPEDKMGFGMVGTTKISQAPGKEHTCSSEYGVYTVSVNIAIGKKSFRLLAHELGHVSYQIPNLARYKKFYVKNYAHSGSRYKGHNPKDLSGQQAHSFEKKLIEQYKEYIKSRSKIISPLVMFNRIKRSSSANLILADVHDR